MMPASTGRIFAAPYDIETITTRRHHHSMLKVGYIMRPELKSQNQGVA